MTILCFPPPNVKGLVISWAKRFRSRGSYLFAVGKWFYDIQKFFLGDKVGPFSESTLHMQNAKFQGSARKGPTNDHYAADVDENRTM